MSLITVSGGQIENYQGEEATLKLRVYNHQAFMSSTGIHIAKGATDSAFFYIELACMVADHVITFPSFSLHSTEDAEPNTSNYAFALYTDEGESRGVVYKHLTVPATPTPTTLPALVTHNAAASVDLPDTYYKSSVIDQMFAGLVNMAIKATDAILGAMRLNYPAANVNIPIAVSDNHPSWRAVNTVEYLETYGQTQEGLADALSSIGSTQTLLKVTRALLEIKEDTELPPNIVLDFDGPGSITVNNGVTLTVGSMLQQAPGKIFFGAGSTVFAKNAVQFFDISWWAGTSNSGNLSLYFDQATTSLENNEGGLLKLGLGDWAQTNFQPPSGSIIEGSGNLDNFGSGTAIKLYDTDHTDPAVRIGEGLRNILFRNLTISSAGSTSASPILFEGDGTDPANTTLGVDFQNCTIHSTGVGAKLVNVHSLANSWECIRVAFQSCMFIAGGSSSLGFFCDTPNSGFAFRDCTAYVAAGGSMIKWTGIGTLKVSNMDWRGPGALAATSASNRTVTASITTGVVTLTVGAFTANDIGQRFVRGAVDSVITGVTAAGTATIANTGASASSGSATIYRYTPNTSMPKACIWSAGAHGAISVDGGEDEGYQYFYINDASDLANPLTIEGATIQAPMRFNQSGLLTLIGNGMFSQLLWDESPATAIIHSFGNRIKKTSILSGVQLDLVKPKLWGPHNSNSIVFTDLNTPQDIFINKFGAPVQVFPGPEFDTNPAVTIPVLAAGHAFPSDGGVTKPMLQIGYVDPLTGEMLHSYSMQRDADTGFMTWVHSQTDPFNGYKFDAPMHFDAAVNATGAVVGASSITSSSPSAGIGYATGAGGSVIQGTSKATGVTLNKICGQVTMHNAALADATTVTFTVTNSVALALHEPAVWHSSAGTGGAYQVWGHTMADGSFKISVRNVSGGSLSEAIVLHFACKKSVIT